MEITYVVDEGKGRAATGSQRLVIAAESPLPINQGPALALTNTVLSVAENGSAMKVADVIVTDDGRGNNTVSPSGSDAGARAC